MRYRDDKQDIASRPPESVGRFAIESRIGTGAMGIVYRAFDPRLGHPVALKRVHEDDPARQTRLLREAHALARVSHPNVVRVYDANTLPDGLYIAMELIDGLAMDDWVDRLRPPLPQVMSALMAAGSALAASHAASVIHGDFKPANVLITRDGEVKLVDFGLARLREGDPPDLSDPWITRLTAARAGTPAYMAPEQLRGIAVDERSDQFAFCVAAYELLSGRRPYKAKSAIDLEREIDRERIDVGALEHVPNHVRVALVRGLRADPALRHPSMSELVARLAAPPSRLGWTIAIALGVILLAAGGGAIGYMACR